MSQSNSYTEPNSQQQSSTVPETTPPISPPIKRRPQKPASKSRAKRTKNGGANRSRNPDGLEQTPSNDPPNDLEQELREPVQLDAPAQLYGLDLAKLQTLAKPPEDSSEARATSRELQVLTGVKTYLEQARGAIKREGNTFHIRISQLPCRILSVGKKRFGNCLHQNRESRHSYTNIEAGVLYRCPLPGCGGWGAQPTKRETRVATTLPSSP